MLLKDDNASYHRHGRHDRRRLARRVQRRRRGGPLPGLRCRWRWRWCRAPAARDYAVGLGGPPLPG